MQHLVLYTVCLYCVSLHVPAGACILVTSVSPVHVPPIQHVLKHCGVIIINLYILYIYKSKTILGHPSCSWGVKTRLD